MKLLQVFGAVVGAHLAVLAFIFATPGCRSTGAQKPRPEDTLSAASSAPGTPIDSISPVSALPDAELNPGVTDLSTATPVTPVGSTAATHDGSIRFSPTRPAVAAAPAPEAPAAAPRATHTIVSGDSLWSLSRKYGVSTAELAAANQLAPSATLRLGQQIIVPAKATAAAPAPDSDAANTYEVVSGDTLGGIARRQGTTVSALRAANNLSGDALRVGQKLVIPGNATPLATTLNPAAGPAAAAPRAGSGTYTVVPGDTLGSIARRHGVKVGDIAILNTVTDPGKLRVGQTLRLPANAKSPTAPAPAAAAVSAPATPEPALPPPSDLVTPVAPPATIEPMAVPVIRID